MRIDSWLNKSDNPGMNFCKKIFTVRDEDSSMQHKIFKNCFQMIYVDEFPYKKNLYRVSNILERNEFHKLVMETTSNKYFDYALFYNLHLHDEHFTGEIKRISSCIKVYDTGYIINSVKLTYLSQIIEKYLYLICNDLSIPEKDKRLIIEKNLTFFIGRFFRGKYIELHNLQVLEINSDLLCQDFEFYFSNYILKLREEVFNAHR